MLRRLRPILRWRYLILTAAAFGFSLQHLRGTGIDWRYFELGSELLFGQHRPATPFGGGLHFYANYPDFQIGPLSLAIAAPIRVIGGAHSRELGTMLMTALAPLLVLVLERSSRVVRPPQDERDEMLRGLTVLLGGLLLVEAWAPLSTIYAHLDDVLTLAAAVGATWAVANRRPIWVGIALGAAIAAKPWGVVALPLALAFRGRSRVAALAIAGGIATLAWAPFVIADTDTLHAVQPQNRVALGSVWHLFGLPAMDAPAWIRAVQLTAALVVGVLAIWRDKWPAVLLVGIAARVALDPQVFLYYGTGLVLAAFAWDLLRTRATLPLCTLFTFVFLNDAYITVSDPQIRAGLRLVVTLALVVAVLFRPPQPFMTAEDTALGIRPTSPRRS